GSTRPKRNSFLQETDTKERRSEMPSANGNYMTSDKLRSRSAGSGRPAVRRLEQFLDQGLGLIFGDAQRTMGEGTAFVEDGFEILKCGQIGAFPKKADGNFVAPFV